MLSSFTCISFSSAFCIDFLVQKRVREQAEKINKLEKQLDGVNSFYRFIHNFDETAFAWEEEKEGTRTKCSPRRERIAKRREMKRPF